MISTFKGCKVVVSPNTPDITCTFGKYFALWYLNKNLKPVILIDTPAAKAYDAGKLDLTQTLHHEYDEALLAIKLANQAGHTKTYMLVNYTGKKPIKEQELSYYGGLAHEILVKEYPGGCKAYYKDVDVEYDIAYYGK